MTAGGVATPAGIGYALAMTTHARERQSSSQPEEHPRRGEVRAQRHPHRTGAALGLALAVSFGSLAMPTAPASAQATTPATPAPLVPPTSPSLGPIDNSTNGPITTAPATTAPVAGFNGATIVMTRSVWNNFVLYLENHVTTGFGFFMVTVDGGADAVRDCPDYACEIDPIQQASALDDCKTANRNIRCVIFAEGRHIKLGYQVLP